ncbi:MAG TPA: hypothetical protein PKA10_13440 [Selenomonadales bacterium]|nr:hypothetical protein [Selenomonadales bacterium]
MSCRKQSMMSALMNMGGRKSDRMSWPKMIAAGALIYLGTKMLHGIMDDND